MKAEYIPPKEDVIMQNEAPDDVYIIVSGEVEIFDCEMDKELVVGTLHSGDMFGEFGALCCRPQMFTFRTKTLSQLLRLKTTDRSLVFFSIYCFSSFSFSFSDCKLIMFLLKSRCDFSIFAIIPFSSWIPADIWYHFLVGSLYLQRLNFLLQFETPFIPFIFCSWKFRNKANRIQY